MGAYENPGQFQIYDPTGDMMLAQAFGQIGANVASAIKQKRKEQRENAFKVFELNEQSLKQLNKQEVIVLNKAEEFGLDVNSVKEYTMNLKDKAYEYDQEINRLKVKGEMPSKELINKRDKAQSELTFGLTNVFDTIRQVSEVGDKINFASLGTEGNVSASVDANALKFIKDFNVNGEGNKIKISNVLDTDGNETIGIQSHNNEIATVFGLQTAMSKINRIVPKVTENVGKSTLLTSYQDNLKNKFTKENIKELASTEKGRNTLKELGTFSPYIRNGRVYERFNIDKNKIQKDAGSITTLENLSKLIQQEYTPEQKADIYNNVFYNTQQINGKLERINTKSNETAETKAKRLGLAEEDISFIDFTDNEMTEAETRLFDLEFQDHYRNLLTDGLSDDAINFDDVGKPVPKEPKVDTEDGKVTPIDIVNFTEIGITPLEKDEAGKVTPQAINLYLDNARNISKGKFDFVSKGDLDSYVLENTKVDPRDGKEASGADTIPILEYWTERTQANLGKNNYPEKGASMEEIESYAKNKALEPIRKKLGAGTYDFDYYKIVRKTPVKFLDSEIKRLQTNEGRYNFWRTNVMSETDAKRKELKNIEKIVKTLDKYERGEELTDLELRAIQTYLNKNTK